jgi:hypothetical protein
LRSRIGGDRLLGNIGQRAVGGNLEAQRRRKAFVFAIPRLTINDNRNDPLRAAECLELADFLVDVFAYYRVG